MRLAGCVLCAWYGLASAAPSADELRAQGEQLAKEGRYTEAIVAFKQSNAEKPRATNLCLIGLAYTRREAWSQAEVMIDRCKQLASAADPAPDWLPELERLVIERLANVAVAPITITVEPPGAQAQLSVSSFAPDELFSPRTIHLPTGSHLVIATAPGYERMQKTIDVADRTPQHVVIELRASAVPVDPRAPSHLTSNVLLGAGAAIIAAGIIYHATYFATAAHKLADATNPKEPHPDEYDMWSHRYDVRRTTLVALYTAGVVTAGIGLALRLTRETEHDVVAIVPVDGGAIVTLGGTR